MKQKCKLITILFVSFLSSPSWCETFTIDDLVKRDGLYYEKFTDVPFTGNISGKTKGKIENGKADGPWRDYYKNGQLNSKGNYKAGNMDGDWVIFYETGQLLSIGSYKDGKKDNLWQGFDTKDQLLWITFYTDGEEDGPSEKYEDGQLIEQGLYTGGKKDGLWVTYYNNGQLKTKGNYRNGKKDGAWFTNFFSGRVATQGNCKNGNPQRGWLYFTDDDYEIRSSSTHDAYEDSFGYHHRREIKIDKKSGVLLGLDELTASKVSTDADFNVRFHLYPGVNAVQTMAGNSILIQMAKNKSLVFKSEGENLSIEKSIFLGRNKILNNLCITISGNISTRSKNIHWEIRKSF